MPVKMPHDPKNVLLHFNRRGKFARRIKLDPLLFVGLSLIRLILQTEIPLTGYLEALRDTIPFGFALAIVFALPTPKWSA